MYSFTLCRRKTVSATACLIHTQLSQLKIHPFFGSRNTGWADVKGFGGGQHAARQVPVVLRALKKFENIVR